MRQYRQDKGEIFKDLELNENDNSILENLWDVIIEGYKSHLINDSYPDYIQNFQNSIMCNKIHQRKFE